MEQQTPRTRPSLPGPGLFKKFHGLGDESDILNTTDILWCLMSGFMGTTVSNAAKARCAIPIKPLKI